MALQRLPADEIPGTFASGERGVSADPKQSVKTLESMQRSGDTAMNRRRVRIGGGEFWSVLVAAAVLLGAWSTLPALAGEDGESKDGQKSAEKEGCDCGDCEKCEGNKQDKDKEKKDEEWRSLFDGESLGNWKPTEFGGEGNVHVEGGKIMLPFGAELTGITWAKDEPPFRINYEIELKAMRVDGTDFFCGLTFPVGESPCTLILGGWGGGVTGLSSLDGFDASQNNTSQWINYKSDQWYHVRLRVTENKIESWLDEEKIVDADIRDKKVSIRPEVELSKPLGIASWQTTAALKDIRIRPVEEAADPVPED